MYFPDFCLLLFMMSGATILDNIINMVERPQEEEKYDTEDKHQDDWIEPPAPWDPSIRLYHWFLGSLDLFGDYYVIIHFTGRNKLFPGCLGIIIISNTNILTNHVTQTGQYEAT